MAIAYFGSAVNVSASAGITSISVPIGSVSSIPAGAVIVVAIERRNSAVDAITMTGYTQVRNVQNGTDNAGLVILYKVAAGSDGNVNATWGTSVVASAAVAVYTGVDTSGSPWIAENGSIDTGLSGTTTTPSVTNTDAAACAVTVYGNSMTNGTDYVPTSPQTERIEGLVNVAAGRSGISINDVMNAAATATTYTSVWTGGTGAQTRKGSWLGFLKPIVPTGKSDSDTGSGADTAAVSAAAPGSDTGSGADSGVVSAQVPATETGSGSDSAAVSAQVPATDTGSGADSATVKTAATDTGSGTDSGVVSAQVPDADTGSGTDTAVAIPQAVAVPASDTGSGTDSAAVSASVPGSDTGSGADAAAVSAAVPGDEAGSGADSATLKTVGTDTGSGTDSAAVSVAAPTSDTGSGSDSAAVSAQSPAGDSGSGTDTAAVNAAAPATDTGSGADTGTVSTVTVTAADTGSGTDAANLAITLPVTDTGSGADTAAVAASVPGADVGAGSDAATLTRTTPASDTGSGADTASALPAAQKVAIDSGSATDSAVLVVVGFAPGQSRIYAVPADPEVFKSGDADNRTFFVPYEPEEEK